jgi:hypothetical protein
MSTRGGTIKNTRRKKMAEKLMGEKLKKRDANALVHWWNGNACGNHELRKMADGFYDVVRV